MPAVAAGCCQCSSHRSSRAKRFPRKPGVLIDVARFISASQDRATGQVVFRIRDQRGRLVALRMRRRQFQTFATRADELAEALEAEG